MASCSLFMSSLKSDLTTEAVTFHVHLCQQEPGDPEEGGEEGYVAQDGPTTVSTLVPIGRPSPRGSQVYRETRK